MGNLNLVAKPCGVLLLCAAAAVALPGQTAPVSPPVPTVTFTSLVSFDGTDGDIPTAGLVQAANGDLYGTTQFGGSGDCYSGCGTVFKMMPNGALTTIYNFCAQQECPEGFQPVATLTLGKDGNLYGTTSSGGANECTLGDCGSIFKVTPNGALTVLYSFCSTINNLTCVDGAHPAGALVQATDGSFYGTTYYGGHSNPSCALEHSCGTIFKITPDGTFTTLYSFAGKDGANPSSQLIQGADGNFYGTASGGGDFVRCVYGCGTIFRITPAGILTTLYSFCSLPKCADGYEPTGGLVPGPDGKFYGTTQQGGGQHCLNGCGTIFQFTPANVLTTIYSFCPQPGCVDGNNPYSSPILGTDGNFYGSTGAGGSDLCDQSGCGTLFQLMPSGTLTTLHTFEMTDGSYPYTGVMQATNGAFYGTTYGGGTNTCGDGDIDCGTVFGLSVNLGPFITTTPPAGRIGAKVGILGTDLTGATGVTFNGIAAEFKIVSPTLIAAKVPSGAATGTVQVQLPSGKLTSSVPFIVLR